MVQKLEIWVILAYYHHHVAVEDEVGNCWPLD